MRTRLRRSTVLLGVVFVATFVLYVLVRPGTDAAPSNQPSPRTTVAPSTTRAPSASRGA